MHRINISSTLNQIKHTTLFRRMTFVGLSLFFCVRCTVPYVESKEQSKLSNLEVGCEYNNVCLSVHLSLLFTPCVSCRSSRQDNNVDSTSSIKDTDKTEEPKPGNETRPAVPPTDV